MKYHKLNGLSNRNNSFSHVKTNKQTKRETTGLKWMANKDLIAVSTSPRNVPQFWGLTCSLAEEQPAGSCL